MHNYLTQDIDFNTFLSLFSCHYIKGMPIQTFEALLQICLMRIYLYAAAVDDTYNSRAISTLPSESYFSDVKHIDEDGRGYKKGPAVNKLVGKSAMVNALKHKVRILYTHFYLLYGFYFLNKDCCFKPNNFYFRTYHLAPSSRGVYPVLLTDEDKTDLQGQDNRDEGLFKNLFFFYYQDTRVKSCIRRDDISEGLATLRSVHGTRRCHITDDSRIDPAKSAWLGPVRHTK